MSNRFHNKFHRHNHHTESSDDSQFPDSSYDPIASPESPFKGAFVLNGSLSANGDTKLHNLTCDNITIEGTQIYTGPVFFQVPVNINTDLQVDGTSVSNNSEVAGTLIVTGNTSIGNNVLFIDTDYQRVGINTDSPNKELTVVGDISATGTINADGYNSAIWDDTSVTVQSNSASWSENSLIGSMYLPISGGALTGPLSTVNSIYVDGSLEIGTGTVTTLFVSSALVGINTETPNEALTVVGNVSATGTFFGDGSGLTNLAAAVAPDNAVRALTANWEDTSTVVQSNSASWAVDNSIDTDVRALTANWQDSSTVVQSNSANWETAYEIGTAYSSVSSTFLTSETDSQTLSFDEGTKDLTISSGNTVSLSALVDSIVSDGVDTDIRALTANWENTSTVVQSSSANWDDAYTTVQSNSASWTIDNSIDTDVRSLTANWDDTTTVVQSNSASWNYQGSDLKALSANWETAYEISTAYSSASSTFLTTETDSQTLSFDEGTNDLTISNGNTISLSALVDGIDTDVRSLTANWEDSSTVVQSNSASWAVDNSIDTDVRALTATWEDSSTVVQSNSAVWNDTYTVVQSNSASWAIDNSIDTDVRSLTANWDDTSTVVQSNSADWNTAYEISTAYSSVSSTFLTSETDSQSLSFDENNKDLTISNGNTVSLSALVDLTATDTGVRALTANWEDSSTVVQSNSASWAIDNSIDTDVRSLTATWEDSSTVVQSNSASWAVDPSLYTSFLPLSGGNLTGPLSSTNSIYVNGALEIGTGSTTTLFVSSTLVGINTEAPSEALTVIGNVSASGAVYASKGNSNIWDDTSTVVQSNSASWAVDNSIDTDVRSLTANWEDSSTVVQSNSASWNTAYEISTAYSSVSSTFLTTETDSQTLSFDEGTKDLTISNGNTVSLSALVDLTAMDTGVRALTSNWQSTYTTVNSNSASWSAPVEVLVAQVTNADSVTLNRGDVVYSFGATGSVMSVKRASNSAEATSSKTLGIVNETIIPGGTGYVTVAGRMDKLSLPSPYVDGDALWLGSTAGTFTRVKSTSPNHLVYLGVVERANNGNGIAYIKVQNGYELDELHDVLINGVQAKDLLQRNGANTLWINGPLSADGSNITSGTIGAARMPTFNGDITATTTNDSVSAKVVAIQGGPISTQSPSTGQMLQWTGTAWTPGTIPTGGSGGGGLSYYFNFGTEAQSPTTNLSATPNTPKELGTVGTVLSSSYTSGNLSQTNYDLICGFVSLTGTPNTTTIPAGLWDFNIWASTNGTFANQTIIRLDVYKYNGVNNPTLIASSDDIGLYDPAIPAQYIASVVMPQTTILTTDRIYIEIRAKAVQTNRQVTIYFGDGRPSHVHTTLPSVGGTGLVKVINGVYQSPASLLVDADVASNANIAQSKINGLTDVADKANSTYTTVQSNSATTWNYQGTDLKALSGNWQSAYTTVQSNSATEWDNTLAIAYAHNNFLPLSGGTLTGKLTASYASDEAGINIGNGTVPLSPVVGDLWMQQYSLNWRSPAGTHAAAIANGVNTFSRRQIISTTDTSDALRITQTGTGNALLIEDSTNPDVTPFVIDSFGSVGIGLSSLSGIDTKLTVIGNISASGTVYTVEGNSEQWSGTYTTVQSNSATVWNYQGTDLKALSANWQSAYTTVQANSAITWNYQGTDLKALSANWQSAYTIVQANSAAWSSNVGFSTLLGDSVTNPLTATHNLNTKDIVFSVREVATNNIVQAAGRVIDNNNLELTFNSTPTVNQYDLTVLSNGGAITGGGTGTSNAFALVVVTAANYIQVDTYTHNLYNDTAAGGQIVVTLLPPANHIAVTQHKKIGSTASIVLSAPGGATIDGQSTYTLTNQYEAIGLYSDGTNYFIQ